MLTLKVSKRERGEDVEILRQGGKIPAIFYGPKEEATSITIDTIAFEKVWRQAGESSVVQLQGLDEEKDALIYEVDTHPVTGALRHADFYVFEKGKTVQVAVPLVFTGESKAEKELGGTLVKVMHELDIEAMPKDLPHEIVVDISPINDFETFVHVKDLVLPAGVTTTVDGNETVAQVAAPQEEEEEAPTEIDMSAIEVVGEKEKQEKAAAEAAEKAEEK